MGYESVYSRRSMKIWDGSGARNNKSLPASHSIFTHKFRFEAGRSSYSSLSLSHTRSQVLITNLSAISLTIHHPANQNLRPKRQPLIDSEPTSTVSVYPSNLSDPAYCCFGVLTRRYRVSVPNCKADHMQSDTSNCLGPFPFFITSR